jgi:DNA-binding beta-propeller fold protein YncE
VNCWSQDNQIIIIDNQNDVILDSIRVTKQPNSMVIDKNNHLWVVSDGSFQGSSYGQTKGALQCIDLETKSILFKLEFPIEDSPGNLIINSSKDTLYFVNKHVYRMSIVANEPELFITRNDGQIFSCLGLHPMKNEFYLGDALDYTKPGKVFRYTSSGVLIDEFRVGMIPTQFIFY